MNRNNNFKTLEEKKKELASLRAEWEKMKEQEKKLKEKFYRSPFEERAKIKRELTSLQEEIFEKGECGHSVKYDIKKEELLQRLKNPVGKPTDPQHLANLIKADLRGIIAGDRKVKNVARLAGEYWEIGKGKEFWAFVDDEEIKKGIENLSRNRNKTIDPDRITSRMISVKRGDLEVADFEEIISLIRQAKKVLEEKDKQEQRERENKRLNNPHLFTQWRCSTDGKYNGRGRWENWHTFSGKHNGHNYTIYVPDNHFLMTAEVGIPKWINFS